FPKLRTLNLIGTGVTDVGLERFRAPQGLTRVFLDGTQVTEAGAKRLRSTLPGCQVSWEPRRNADAERRAAERVLELGGTASVTAPVQVRDVRSIGDLPGGGFFLYAAGLSGRAVTDSDLEYLEPLWAIRRLDLSRTGVGDAGLVHLR